MLFIWQVSIGGMCSACFMMTFDPAGVVQVTCISWFCLVGSWSRSCMSGLFVARWTCMLV